MDITIFDPQGRKLDARVESIGNDLIVHSRSGRHRNPDYRPAVEAVIAKLDAAKIKYEIFLDSRPVQALPLAQRKLNVPNVGSVVDRFNALVKATNAGGVSNGAYRRIRFVTSTLQTGLVSAFAATHPESGVQLDPTLAPGEFTLEPSHQFTTAGFQDWFEALAQLARDNGNYYRLPGPGVGFRRLRHTEDDTLRLEFWIGDSESSAVQINEPNAPGTENPLAALARDNQGNRFIVRQGILHRNKSSARITAPDFVRRSGLMPLNMWVGAKPAGRQWHLVTGLDGTSSDEIVRNTQEFVARCWKARTGRRTSASKVERLTAAQLRRVTSANIDQAVSHLLAGNDAPNFAESTDYDVLARGNVRLAPKKVFGLALEEALGIEAFPGHFTAGHGNPCFLLIEAAGYPIIAKTDAAPHDQEPIDPDLAAAEGHPKVVKHLKRERKPALAAAKRRAMIAELGFLRCESCELIPSQKLGPHGDAVIEVHHATVQVGKMTQGHVTRLADLQCLCANCHRIVHRKMANAG